MHQWLVSCNIFFFVNLDEVRVSMFITFTCRTVFSEFVDILKDGCVRQLSATMMKYLRKSTY